MADLRAQAASAVLVQSTPIPKDAVIVKGPPSITDTSLSETVASYKSIGFQATNVDAAIRQITAMLTGRRDEFKNAEEAKGKSASSSTGYDSDDDSEDAEQARYDARQDALPFFMKKCTLFLGVVSHLFATGVRESLAFIVSQRLTDLLVVSGGGLEHDIRRLFPWHRYHIVAEENNTITREEEEEQAAAEGVWRWVQTGNVRYRHGPCPDSYYESLASFSKNSNSSSSAAAIAACPYRLGCFEHFMEDVVSSMCHGDFSAMGGYKKGPRCPSSDPDYHGATKSFVHGNTLAAARSSNNAAAVLYTPSAFWREVGNRMRAPAVLGALNALQQFKVEGGGNEIPQQQQQSQQKKKSCGVETESVVMAASKAGIPLYSPNFGDGDIANIILRVTTNNTTASGSSSSSSKQQQQNDGNAQKNKSNTHRRRRLHIDLVADMVNLVKTSLKARRSGMVVLGGGVIKHHCCNANLFRNGSDHTVFINNAQEFDGSDAGARPDEAVSWGKIKAGTAPVKVYTEASLVFPLLVARAFYPYAVAHPVS